MNILAIESSCDETACAVVRNGKTVLSNVISSQIDLHAKFFGVVPEIASRAHIQNINFVVAEALKKAGISFADESLSGKRSIKNNIDAVAFTQGPGLAGCLLVGAIGAKSLAYVYNLPLIPVNHLEGHMYSAMIENSKLKPPFLSVIISGGHTELIIVKDFGKYKLLGQTRDDALGEAFDKAAKMLGLSYPGGPVVDKLAEEGNPKAVKFTRPMLKGSWDFSFSGIKTALLNYLKANPIKNKQHLADVCASFRAAVCETVAIKAFSAAEDYGLKQIALGGGVSANRLIRKIFAETAAQKKMKVFMPSLEYCTDNAAMIAVAAYYKRNKKIKDFSVNPSLELQNW
jgi:N6-L-threonylcarbamoyladenine synthase